MKTQDAWFEILGLPYRLDHPSNVFGAVASAGSSHVVMARTEDGVVYCGYYFHHNDAVAARDKISRTRKFGVVNAHLVEGSRHQ